MLLASCASLLVTAGLALYDYLENHRKKHHHHSDYKDKKGSQSIKILLTGGPCGGKSQGINCIYYSFKSITAPVFIVPEAATIIGTAGLTLDLSQFQPRQIELFQIYLMRLQFNLEEIVMDIARNLEKLEKPPVVLCDRGLLDGKAYAGEENWAKMLKQINQITEQQILDRYKAAIHMVTAAKGAETFYNYTVQEVEKSESDNSIENEGLKVRRQSPEMAVQLDEKLQNCYKDHPNRYVISNEFFVKNFEDKKTVLLAQVYQIITQLIKRNDLSEYYSDYETSIRKNSEENISILDTPSPYLIRKRKFQKFLHRGASPTKLSAKKYTQ